MLRPKFLLCWNNGLLGFPKLFSISFQPLQGINGTHVGWFSSKWLQTQWLCYVIVVSVLNKKHSSLMVVWLKVGIGTWHHKGRKWGAEAVRETTPPHIPASNSTLLWSEHPAPVLAKRGESFLLTCPGPRCSPSPKNAMQWNYRKIVNRRHTVGGRIWWKIIKDVDFKSSTVTNSKPVEGFGKMLNVVVCKLFWTALK